MSRGPLPAGAELPEYRTSARAPATHGENRIHEDGFARTYGFRGGLVPGVTVYAWMTHPIVAALGLEWLERGGFSARFAKPVYFGEPVTIASRVADRADDRLRIESRVLNAAGEICATGSFSMEPRAPAAPDVAAYPPAPLPEERPLVSREWLAARPVLGTPVLELSEGVAGEFLDRVSEPLPMYREPRAPAHPGLYLDQANRGLDRNVRVSPWMHVESHGQHFGLVRMGEQLETRVRVNSLFEKKGHEFVELDLLLLADGTRPVASVRHVAIYKPRPPV